MILKRAKSTVTNVSPVPKWDALRSWFALEGALKAAQERAESPRSLVKEETTEEDETRKENAAVFAQADKDWQDAGWG